MKKDAQKAIAFGILGFIIVAFAYWQLISPVSFTAKEAKLFQIDGGQGLAEISENLEAKNFIRSDKIFILYAKLRGLEGNIRQGRYRLSQNMDIKTILAALTDPERGTVSVTIPEGFSVRDIDERLVSIGLILPGEFSSKALLHEGFLFPDTYYVFSRNFDADDLIKKMQDNFSKKITVDLMQEAEKRKRTLQEIITIASIAEKEVRTEKDYPIVTGILWKRLDHDWPLQADATLLYGKSIPIITTKELTEDSPYNTRKYKGLPPTPINNPGLATIRAAIFAEESPYWFYLTDSDGNVHYAKSNEEHNENRRKYL
ncbi:endolytic transglycosylase MltG [Candidatus Peregrinibacteria bacterium]|nr:endolytic transglycosylase MltG [Candidatus Peregrinibacteria bacterium]